MPLLAVEGIYKDGKIELVETLPEVREARVMVVFLPEGSQLTPGIDGEAGEQRFAAAERLLARMKKGYHLGGGRPYDSRAELHDRLERHG